MLGVNFRLGRESFYRAVGLTIAFFPSVDIHIAGWVGGLELMGWRVVKWVLCPGGKGQPSVYNNDWIVERRFNGSREDR